MSYTTTDHTPGKGRVLKTVAVAAAGLGIVAALAASGVAVTNDHTAAQHHASAPHTVTPIHYTPQTPGTGQHIAPAPQPAAATPSAAVASLQRELGQLNYYEGHDDGIEGPETIAAIKDLQRVAGLPQTGVMDAATDSALIHQLTFGNSQMGGGA